MQTAPMYADSRNGASTSVNMKSRGMPTKGTNTTTTSNVLSSPMNPVPPASKKQRATKTPPTSRYLNYSGKQSQISSSTTNDAINGMGHNKSNLPGGVTSTNHLNSNSTTSSTNASANTNNSLSNFADDAIARRRYQLRLLQEQRGTTASSYKSLSTNMNNSSNLIARARAMTRLSKIPIPNNYKQTPPKGTRANLNSSPSQPDSSSPLTTKVATMTELRNRVMEATSRGEGGNVKKATSDKSSLQQNDSNSKSSHGTSPPSVASNTSNAARVLDYKNGKVTSDAKQEENKINSIGLMDKKKGGLMNSSENNSAKITNKSVIFSSPPSASLQSNNSSTIQDKQKTYPTTPIHENALGQPSSQSQDTDKNQKKGSTPPIPILPSKSELEKSYQEKPDKFSSSKKETLMSMRNGANTPPRSQSVNIQQLKPQNLDDIDNDNISGITNAFSITESNNNNDLSKYFDNTPSKYKLKSVSNGVKSPETSPLGKMATKSNTNQSSAHIELLKQLNLLQSEKSDALKKIAKAQDEIALLRLRHNDFIQNAVEPDTNSNSQLHSPPSETLDSVLHNMIQIVRTKGDDSAINYAKESLLKKVNNYGGSHHSHLNNFNSSSSLSVISRQLSSPNMKGNGRNLTSPLKANPNQNTSNIHKDGVSYRIGANAVRSVEYEFDSDLATYIVRRPYRKQVLQHIHPDDNENVPWWVKSATEYYKTANATDETTLEVAAHIKPDNSLLVLHGSCSVKRGIPASSFDTIGAANNDDQSIASMVSVVNHKLEWTNIDVDSNDAIFDGSTPNELLGKVMFIDMDGNEDEYWLDAIYSEAQAIREKYRSNLFSAACALQASEYLDNSENASGSDSIPKDVKATNLSTASKSRDVSADMSDLKQGISNVHDNLEKEIQNGNTSKLKQNNGNVSNVVMVDVCVGTDDMMNNPPSLINEKDDLKNVQTEKVKDKNIEVKETLKTNEEVYKKSVEDIDIPATSQDAFSSMLLFVVSTVFSTAFFFLVAIPCRVVSASLTFFLILAIISILWLFLADDNGAVQIGAGIIEEYNPPGVW